MCKESFNVRVNTFCASLQYLIDDSAHITDLARHHLMQLEVLGKVCRFLQLIFVFREAPEENKKTTRESQDVTKKELLVMSTVPATRPTESGSTPPPCPGGS